jgi:hypothetical protein
MFLGTLTKLDFFKRNIIFGENFSFDLSPVELCFQPSMENRDSRLEIDFSRLCQARTIT